MTFALPPSAKGLDTGAPDLPKNIQPASGFPSNGPIADSLPPQAGGHATSQPTIPTIGSPSRAGLAHGGAIGNLLDVISRGEGTTDALAQRHGFASGYDVPLGFGAYGRPNIPLSSMTVSQVLAYQRAILHHPANHSNSSAVGRYQITRTNLQRLQGQLGFGTDQVFSPDFQDRLAQQILLNRGIVRFANGQVNSNHFQHNLALEWASIANPETGRPDLPTQHLGNTTAEIQAALSQLRHR